MSARIALLRVIPPLALLALAVGAWQLAVFALDIKPYLLPGPWEVAASALAQRGLLGPACLRTAGVALGGLSLALVAGVAVSFLFAQSPIIRRSCFPYAIFLQTVPIVAIAPLLIQWFGSGPATVVAIAFIICLFPIIANTTAGLTSVSPELRDLFRLHRATRWQRLIKLQLPHAVPHLVTGARTSSGLAVIGAIVGEFFASFGSGDAGLGHLIMYWQGLQKTGPLIAAVIASTLLGVAIFSGVTLASRTVLRRWTQV